MDRQAREARKMAKNLPFGKRIAYIWEYYKYWILGAVFLILAAGGTIYTIVTRPTYDMTIGFYSEQAIGQDTIAELENFLAEYVEDYDGNGEKSVKVYVTSSALLGSTPEAEYAVQNKMFAELAAGSYPVYLVDGVYYNIVTDGSFEDTMESLRDVKASPMAIILPSEDAQPVFWCTRALYGPEEGKEKPMLEHERAVKMELAIFGEREQ